MDKKYGLSALGYAIVSVIVLGIIMIVSAPLVIDSVEQPNKKKPKPINEPLPNNYELENLRQSIRNLENRLYSVEQRNSNSQSESSISDKYVCSIEGLLGEDGNVVPINENNSQRLNSRKIVFVCEYKR